MSLVHDVVVVLSFTLIGGLIGYVTNVIAIEMLFKPRRPYCILPGKRVCIQGLIPARKSALAKRLGEVAAQYAYSDSIRARYKERLEKEVVNTVREIVLQRLRRSSIRSTLAEIVVPGLAELVAKAVSPAIMNLLEEASTRINIAELVEEEFMNLPITELEKIFRQIAGRELRFIELMGFALGALIGLIEGIVALTI